MRVDEACRLLGVDPGCPRDVLRQAYKQAALEHHPDKGGDANAFQKIKQAYDVINNEAHAHVGEDSSDGSEWADMFVRGINKLYTSYNRAKERSQLNVTLDVAVTLKEVYDGHVKKMSVKLFENQTTAFTKTFFIPLYNFKKQHIFKGGGDRNQHGVVGDLIVNLLLQPEELAEYHFDELMGTHDLFTTCTITLKEFLYGGETFLVLPNGERASVAIAPLLEGMQHCDGDPNTCVVVLNGLGLPYTTATPRLDSEPASLLRGDLVVKIRLRVHPASCNYVEDRVLSSEIAEYFHSCGDAGDRA